ncbi:MAG: class I SAM-dependent methyltransferase [Anaerolineales bacterium]|nr:class I SAM-dependent methyltransferase [Anaerolineales bacterium]
MKPPAWFHDQTSPAGGDYSDPAQAAVYDRRHQSFRDYRQEAEAVVHALGLTSEHSVVDIGCGTGAFALNAAPLLRKVYAVDVSPAMLEYCRRRAAERDLRNFVFHRGGFLTYEHDADPVDAAVSTAVLHHLPDFWKHLGLRRVHRMLRRGGRLRLFDIVFPGAMEDFRGPIEAWINSMRKQVGAEFAAEAETHIREEFSTYDWIMEGSLTRAGFRIDRIEPDREFGVAYLCTKPD